MTADPAPDFTLPAWTPDGATELTLSAQRGAPVVLAFYPGDETAVCTVQLKAYNADLAEFEGLGARLFGISPQSVESHERFAANHGFGFPLLADEDKAVGEAYGILGPLGFYRRSIFVVDGEGIVRYSHRSLVGATFKKTPELVEAVKAAQA